MEFGKTEDISKVDFSLPEDHRETRRLLRAWSKETINPPKVFVGYTAWTQKEWVGTLYPPGADAHDFLHHYGNQFSTIELNTTFYRIPDIATVIRWRNSVPETFRFCPKILQDISHRHRLFQCQNITDAFIESVRLFENKLGPCFLQLPPTFGPAQLPRLEDFIHAWPKEIGLAVEFRHESWFDGNPIAEEGFELMEKSGIHAVITDVSGRRDVLHQRLTSKTILLRIVGNALHPSDFDRIENWANRFQYWFSKGVDHAYVFLHQPDCTTIPEFGAHFINSMNRIAGLTLSPLIMHDRDQGLQGELF